MNEPKTMRELHRLREQLYKAQKRLSPKELIARIQADADKLSKEWNLKFRKVGKAA